MRVTVFVVADAAAGSDRAVQRHRVDASQSDIDAGRSEGRVLVVALLQIEVQTVVADAL